MQQPYAQYAQQPPGAMQPPPPPPPSISNPKGFVAALFDFSFASFITTKIIKFLFALQLIAAVLILLGGIVTGIMTMVNASVLAGLLTIVLAPIGAVAFVVFGRLYLELVIVIFRIAEDIGDINRKTR